MVYSSYKNILSNASEQYGRNNLTVKCITIHEDFIFLGIGNIVKVYHSDEKLQIDLVNQKVKKGEVSQISVNHDMSRVCAGYTNGRLSLWNTEFLIEPRLLKTIDHFRSLQF